MSFHSLRVPRQLVRVDDHEQRTCPTWSQIAEGLFEPVLVDPGKQVGENALIVIDVQLLRTDRDGDVESPDPTASHA